VTVDCTSSNATVLADITGVSVTTTHGLLSGTPKSVTIPEAGNVAADTIVTYTCAPAADAGGYTTADSVSFDVLVRNQGIQFVTGSKAIMAGPDGKQVVSGTVTTAISAFESVQYGLGDLLKVQVLDNSVRVMCTATMGDMVLGNVLDEVPDSLCGATTTVATSIYVSGTRSIYLPRMPENNNASVEVKVECVALDTESNMDNGYEETDMATATITVLDIAPPQPEISVSSPQITFQTSLTFKIEPDQATKDALATETQEAVAGTLGKDKSDVSVRESSGRRRLMDVSRARRDPSRTHRGGALPTLAPLPLNPCSPDPAPPRPDPAVHPQVRRDGQGRGRRGRHGPQGEGRRRLRRGLRHRGRHHRRRRGPHEPPVRRRGAHRDGHGRDHPGHAQRARDPGARDARGHDGPHRLGLLGRPRGRPRGPVGCRPRPRLNGLRSGTTPPPWGVVCGADGHLRRAAARASRWTGARRRHADSPPLASPP